MSRVCAALLLLVSAAISCGPAPKPAVFVSLPFIRVTLDAIVRDHIEIIPLLDTGIDPFRPPPELNLPPETLSRSYRLIMMGGGLDDWLADYVRKKRGAVQILPTVETTLYVPGASPCIWLHPGDLRTWVDNLLTIVSNIDKIHAAEFADNALVIKDALNQFYQDLRWHRIPSGKVTFLQYSACSTHLVMAVGPRALEPFVRNPTDLVTEQDIPPDARAIAQTPGAKIALLTLSVDNPEGVKKIKEMFPGIKIVQLKTFPHEVRPNATLLDLASYNVDKILAEDK